jgi:stage II sporulation protein GA (sporulation sigma-E factor processing peptidase)
MGVSILLRRNVGIKRLFLGGLVGGLSVFILFLSITTFQLFLLKIIIAVLMVIVAFKYKDIRYTLKNIFFLYTLSIILGGFLYMLNIEFSYKNSGIIFYHNGLSINWIILLIISPLVIYVYIKQTLKLKSQYSNYYKVDIYFKSGKRIKLNAFLDTGNGLIDPYKKRPIILVNSKEVKKYIDKENFLLVPFTSLDNESLLKCIVADKINIKGIGYKTNFLIGLYDKKINIDGIDCILNTKLLEE